jgi:HSP20 family protein
MGAAVRKGGFIMSLVPWKNKNRDRELGEIEPYDWIDNFRLEMDRVFDRVLGGLSPMGEGGMFRHWGPSIDVSETNNEITVRAEVAGIDPNDLEITVTGNLLTLAGDKKESTERKGENFHHSERRFGSFRRSVSLPSEVNTDDARAEHRNGVVNITLKKKESAVPKRIAVQAGK